MKNIKVTAYADDFAILLSEKNFNQLTAVANNVFDKLTEWSYDNGLLLNVKKTKIMMFGNNVGDQCSLLLRNKDVEQVNSFRYLGLCINGKLDWNLHVNEVTKRLNRTIFLFRQLRHSFTQDHLIIFYRAIFESVLRYGLCFWGQSKQIHRVLILQKRCLRTILFLKPKTSCREVFKKHQIHTVFNLIILETYKFVLSSNNMFLKNSDLHFYNTRQKENLQLQTSNKHLSHFIKIFNKIPLSIRSESNSMSKLKKSSEK